jgi:hypothetical protein
MRAGRRADEGEERILKIITPQDNVATLKSTEEENAVKADFAELQDQSSVILWMLERAEKQRAPPIST